MVVVSVVSVVVSVTVSDSVSNSMCDSVSVSVSNSMCLTVCADAASPQALPRAGGATTQEQGGGQLEMSQLQHQGPSSTASTHHCHIASVTHSGTQSLTRSLTQSTFDMVYICHILETYLSHSLAYHPCTGCTVPRSSQCVHMKTGRGLSLQNKSPHVLMPQRTKM